MQLDLSLKITNDDGTVMLDAPLHYDGMSIQHVLAIEVLEARKIASLTALGIGHALSKGNITQEYADYLMAELNKPTELTIPPVMVEKKCCK